ncbi:MAG: HAMP domain-containing histidine kinase [Lachnospiraceae bacterium]|nr:HAMP domain-containing histidine kinase [Lachnospiraceae bacterium]
MKLRDRLIISFFIILFVPVLLFSAVAVVVVHFQGQGTLKFLTVDLGMSVMIILLFTAIILIMWIYGSIVQKINHLKDAAENIKEGNLDFNIDVRGNDEFSEVAKALEAMRKRLKENAVEKLETENNEKQLISNIAHDLKTPLTAIQGYAEGLLDGVAATPEKQMSYIKTIYNKAGEMNTLLNELTIYSKIDTNRIPYNYQKLNLSDYFLDCVEELGMDLDNQNIQLNYYNQVDDTTEIIADPEQLKRVIHNIVGNSVKYMGKKTGLIQLRLLDVGDFVQVEIEDNGRGIAVKDLPYIFDRMYRGDASRNSSVRGSGIGLSIVQKIIEDHGGKIWATSKEGEGTVMYFVLRKYQETLHEQDIDN